jgi:ribose transport system ATP-binding protein
MSGLLEMRDISKHFTGVQALSAVDFDVERGEVHALVGHNGAGKSTLIKILTGAYERDSGEIRIDGERVTFANPGAAQAVGVGAIYQEVNLIPYLSAPENIFLGREPRGGFRRVDWRAMRREAGRLLDDFGVSCNLDAPVNRLGVATQQMVALARLVSLEAKLVVMDEPTSSLDDAEVRVLFSVIGRLRERGVGLIYVSHRMDENFALADRITVLRGGKLVRTLRTTQTDPVEIIALMLGRKVEDVRASGVTAFSEARVDVERGLVLDVAHLSRGNMPDDVSLSVHRGEIVGLAGLLGSGRTELARTIFGADAADGGTITMNGRLVRAHSPHEAVRAGMGLVSEDRKIDGIVPALSVADNIMLAALPLFARLGILEKARQRAAVDKMIERLDIRTPTPNTPVRNLSGGNQQKVILARWLCRRPALLILDEPTRGVDVGAKLEIQRLIDELAREDGMGILMISSELEEVIEGSDRVAVMKDGRKLGEFLRGEATEERVMKAISEG